MRISTEQLQHHLARGLKPLYSVFGDETLLVLEASDRIRARARAEGHTERTLLTAITDAAISMVFDGHPSGNAVVVQAVDLGGSTNINIRLEAIP